MSVQLTLSHMESRIYEMLPSELIMDVFEWLDVRSLVRCMLVSRRFFLLVSAVMRQQTAMLLYGPYDGKPGLSLTFEIGLPSDGTNQRRHALRFSCLESSAEFDSPGTFHPFSSSSRAPSPSLLSSSPASQPPALEADGASATSSTSSSASTISSSSASSHSRWTAPRATFEFSAKDVPFPIDIETPFESFQTVLWSVSMKRSAMELSRDGKSTKSDGAGMVSRGFTYRYNSTVTKGLERIRQSSFADKPVPQVLPLSDSPATTSSYASTTSSSALKMTMLPASAVHYKGTVNHGGDPWDSPTFVNPPGASRTSVAPRPPRRLSSFDSLLGRFANDSEGDVDVDALDWMRQPCTCGARDTYGIRFEKLSLNCGYILKAHEDVVLAELQRRVKVVVI